MAPVRDKFVIHSKAIVCQDVELKGDITIGASEFLFCVIVRNPHPVSSLGTVVHPKATIFAIAGPIVIGSGCIIEEGAIIVNRFVMYLLCLLPLHERYNLDGERSCGSGTTIFLRSAAVRLWFLSPPTIIKLSQQVSNAQL